MDYLCMQLKYIKYGKDKTWLYWTTAYCFAF